MICHRAVLVFSVLLESARIARAAVQPLTQLTVDGADAVVIPGGFGAAKNLSDFGFKVSFCFCGVVELLLAYRVLI